MLYSDPIIFLIITSSQAIPPWPEETFLRRLTIFRFDFLVEPSGLKTLAPLIVTFNRNLKCNLGLVVKGGVCGCWLCWCLWKANILLPEGWPEVITSPLTPHRLQSVGGICFDFISLPVQWWKWKHNWNSNPFFFLEENFCTQHIINTLSTPVMIAISVIFFCNTESCCPLFPDNLLEEGVSPLEPRVVGVAGQLVVQGAIGPREEVGSTFGEYLDSQGHDLLQANISIWHCWPRSHPQHGCVVRVETGVEVDPQHPHVIAVSQTHHLLPGVPHHALGHDPQVVGSVEAHLGAVSEDDLGLRLSAV